MAKFIPYYMKWHYHFFRIFGQFPLQINRETVKSSLVFHIYVWLLGILYCASFLHLYNYWIDDAGNGPFLEHSITAHISLIACLLAALGASAVDSKFYERFYENIYKIDDFLENVNEFVNYNHHKRRLYITGAVLFSLHALINILETISPVFNATSRNIIQVYYFFLITSIVFMDLNAYTLRMRFRKINNAVHHLLDTESKEMVRLLLLNGGFESFLKTAPSSSREDPRS